MMYTCVYTTFIQKTKTIGLFLNYSFSSNTPKNVKKKIDRCLFN